MDKGNEREEDGKKMEERKRGSKTRRIEGSK
jgi:hypothetical protein